MAKNRHNIGDIQKALMSHTRYIKEAEKPTASENLPTLTEPTAQPAAAEKGGNEVSIDPRILKQFKILARHQKEPTDTLVNRALEHYLRLKSLQLEQAIQELTQEE